jgi:hypothetical protein
MGSLTRKICNAMPCRRMPFFRPALHYRSADPAFFQWYDPKVHQPELGLLDAAGPADPEASLAYLGLNLGTSAAAYAFDPARRR